tara:strand:- start:87 stop:656 length:570 start_codon:yes stop_codon:yes gene_type:complete
MPPAPSSLRSKRALPAHSTRDPDFDPKTAQEQDDDVFFEEEEVLDGHSESDSDWSEVDSDGLSVVSEDEGDTTASLVVAKCHSKERRQVWNSFPESWMKIGYFLELEDRFSIVEREDFYVVVRSPKQRAGYLGNKAKLLEENGFHYSNHRHRWQKPISEGKHDLETWRPIGHSYEADKTLFLDEFDEFA